MCWRVVRVSFPGREIERRHSQVLLNSANIGPMSPSHRSALEQQPVSPTLLPLSPLLFELAADRACEMLVNVEGDPLVVPRR